MIEPQKREAIFLLHQEGMSRREIARRLHVSRNTVRMVIAAGGAVADKVRRDKIQIDPDLLRRLHKECDGYAQRVHEKLEEEEEIAVKYSTLTRMLRELGIGQKRLVRCDRVPDVPGAEMQHDTSPYTIAIGGRPVPVVASSMYLRYSKLRYLKFYRSFKSLEDMNEQAFEWATVRLYHRPMAKTGLIPAKAFEHERSELTELPLHLPAPYLSHDRGTDQYGFTAFDGNYFWVPGTDRKDVKLLEYADRLKIYRGRECLMEYELPKDGVKNKLISPDGCPPPRYAPKNRRKPTAEEEKRLRAMDEVVGAWLDFALAEKPGGVARHRLIRDLYRLSKQMTKPLFVRSVERALKYRIDSIEILRRILHMYMSEGDGTLPFAEVDQSFRARDTYVEGSLTDQPDFSTWEGMLGDEEGEEDHG